MSHELSGCGPAVTSRQRRRGLVCKLTIGLTGSLALAPVAAVTAGVGPASASPPAEVRVGHAPHIPAGTTAVSPLPASTPLRVDVVLQPRDPSALHSYAVAVSTPGSGEYRHYLTEPEFVERFGPTERTIASVEQSLSAAGLRPGAVAADHLSIAVQATAGRLSAAFSTRFSQYRVVGGRIAFANDAAPQIGSSVAPDVQGVVGLDDLTLPAPALRSGPRGDVPPAVAHGGSDGGPEACSKAADDAAADGAYTTDQVAAAYGFPAVYGQGDLGGGQTVALYELQGYGAADIAKYEDCFGTSTPVTAVDVDGGPVAGSGVSEADVDIEQVTALAPDTRILVYEGPNTGSGGYDTYNAIVSQDLAGVVSTSWGLCEQEMGTAAIQAEGTLFEEAAVQGQSVVAAAGDQGSEDCLGPGDTAGDSNDVLAVDDPSSQPFVTGAGGTMWTADGTPPAETAWNDGPTCCWGAGGGGISAVWPMPSYQSGSTGIGVINADSSGAPCTAASGSYCRESPDVSALAGPFPYLEYVKRHWGAWGGTSLSAPLWASLLALSNASSTCDGKQIGFANPLLYEVAASDPNAFQDVTTGDNDLTSDNDGLYPALTGYDMATGLGTPNAAVLPALLCDAALADPVTVTDPGDQTTDLDQPVDLAIQATDSTPGQTLSYSAIGLPSGLSIDPADGVITGSPTAEGSFGVVVTARDGNGAQASVAFSWTVVAITSPSSATAVIGQNFSFTITAAGDPTSIKVTGKLPRGIRGRNVGGGQDQLSGEAKTSDLPGSYPLVITATYGKGKEAVVATQHFTLTLDAG